MQNQIKSGLSEKEIRSSWKKGIEKYKLMTEKISNWLPNIKSSVFIDYLSTVRMVFKNVEDGFSYSSGTNPNFLDVNELKYLITKNLMKKQNLYFIMKKLN